MLRPQKGMSEQAQETPQPAKDNGKIRPGQKRPFHRGTSKEIEKRVEFICLCIGKGLTKYAMKQAFRSQFGDMSARQIENYIARAREIIVKQSNRSRDEVRADSLAFYRNIIATEKAPVVRIKAQERIDQIYGIDAPRRSELSGPLGGPIKTEETVALPEMSEAKIRELLGRLEAGGNGHSGNNGNGNGNNGNGHHHTGRETSLAS